METDDDLRIFVTNIWALWGLHVERIRLNWEWEVVVTKMLKWWDWKIHEYTVFTAIMFQTENELNDGFMLFAKYNFVNDFKWAGLFRVT